jgi:hypothetical protein
MAPHTEQFFNAVEKRGERGTPVRSAEGPGIGLTKSAAQDAKRLAIETTQRASQLSAGASGKG